jgi:hypothetical protein
VKAVPTRERQYFYFLYDKTFCNVYFLSRKCCGVRVNNPSCYQLGAQ